MADMNDLQGLLDMARQFQGAMSPTEEERRRARAQAAIMAGLGMMATPKGREWQGIPAAAAWGINDYRAGLDAAQQGRMQSLQGAGQLMDMAAKMRAQQEQQRQQQAMQGAIAANTTPGMPPMGPPTAQGEYQPAVQPSLDTAGFARSLEAIDPFKAAAYRQSLAKESPFDKPKPENFTPESRQRFAQTGNWGDLVSADKGDAWQDIGQQNGQFWQRNSKTGEVRAVGSRPPVTTVNLPPMESAEATTIGKARGEAFTSIAKAAAEQAGKVRNLDAMEALLSGVDTTALTPVGMRVAGAARAIGVDIDPQLPAKEAAQAIGNRMTLDARSTAEGGGMPGAMSDADREFLKQSVPNLGQTPGGRKTLIEINRRIAKRAQETYKLAIKYRQERGTFDEGFGAYAEQHFADKPLFADLMQQAGSASPNAGIQRTQDLRRKYGLQ